MVGRVLDIGGSGLLIISVVLAVGAAALWIRGDK